LVPAVSERGPCLGKKTAKQSDSLKKGVGEAELPE